MWECSLNNKKEILIQTRGFCFTTKLHSVYCLVLARIQWQRLSSKIVTSFWSRTIGHYKSGILKKTLCLKKNTYNRHGVSSSILFLLLEIYHLFLEQRKYGKRCLSVGRLCSAYFKYFFFKIYYIYKWHLLKTKGLTLQMMFKNTLCLFIIARTWKQPRCPSEDEWIRKLWYIYTMEYNSAIKKNSSESVLMRWMKLEPIVQSEVSQKDKEHYSILTHIYGI